MKTNKLILHLWFFTTVSAFMVVNTLHPFSNWQLIIGIILPYLFYQLLLYHENNP